MQEVRKTWIFVFTRNIGDPL